MIERAGTEEAHMKNVRRDDGLTDDLLAWGTMIQELTVLSSNPILLGYCEEHGVGVEVAGTVYLLVGCCFYIGLMHRGAPIAARGVRVRPNGMMQEFIM
ncbi:hypothetical protein NDU88_004100 [Pleurodeles waltl]|uniref:Uncharacterized protein n=1 Tax=Pleurodeles waltl TaxID=8319 RepID=A0AAV7TR01_PLEWA|nr:hypothetical protein NDU88_004100 [Pleurodeles waltl]